MKKIPFIIILLAIASGWVALALASRGDISDPPVTSGSEDYRSLSEQAQDNRIVLLDVRTKAEFDELHAVGARNYDLEWLKANVMPDISSDAVIYVYCRTGNRSSQAVDILEVNGFDNLTDLGGLDDWLDHGGEMGRSPYLSLEEIAESGVSTSPPLLGNSAAPITMIEFMDLTCPYCLKFITQTEPQLIGEYVDSGRVKIEFRNAAFRGAGSVTVAAASLCAKDQESFWPYRDNLVQLGMAGNVDITAPAELMALAENMGLDRVAFQACLFDGRYVDLIRTETRSAIQSGITATPSFVINEQALEGALPFESFETIIDSLIQG